MILIVAMKNKIFDRIKCLIFKWFLSLVFWFLLNVYLLFVYLHFRAYMKHFYFIGIVFYKKSNMTTVHKNYRTHQCPYCEYSNRRPAHLKRHILTHTGERPFPCLLCDYRCTQKYQLITHMARKHKNNFWKYIKFLLLFTNK